MGPIGYTETSVNYEHAPRDILKDVGLCYLVVESWKHVIDAACFNYKRE